MQISVAELRAIAESLFSHLEDNGYSVLEIESDFYWHVPKEQRYNPYQNPTNLTLGQLTDDWNELQKIAATDTEPIAFGFIWLSSILQYLGEEVVG